MPAPSPIAASTIAAQACRLLELSPISSFADDSEKALAFAEQYPLALAACLERGDWSFASVYVALPAAILGATDAADPRLPTVYEVPGDCLRLREVGDKWTRWRQDRSFLRASDPAPLAVRYTARIEDEASFPATFHDAVAAELARRLAGRWLQTANKVDRLDRLAEAEMKKALRTDARTASEERYDGGADQDDWADEARA